METDAVIMQLEQRVCELEAQFRLIENARTRDNRGIAESLISLLALICGFVGAEDVATELQKLTNNKHVTDDELVEGLTVAINRLNLLTKDKI
ncbi:unnamed protein product [marine sediment metagenome]|uniref:Uncharacterized protein n=1 Tax=marine sediment metagenome TaxID=412755 RepID=X1EBU0_9ZZZZ